MKPLFPFPPSEGLQTAFPVWYSGTQVFVCIHWVKCKSNLAVFPYMPVYKKKKKKVSHLSFCLPFSFMLSLCIVSYQAARGLRFCSKIQINSIQPATTA